MTDWSQQERTIRPVEGVMDETEARNTDTTSVPAPSHSAAELPGAAPSVEVFTHHDASTQALMSMFDGPSGAKSLEVRWILRGPPPSQLIASFLSNQMEIEARTDRYLIEP